MQELPLKVFGITKIYQGELQSTTQVALQHPATLQYSYAVPQDIRRSSDMNHESPAIVSYMTGNPWLKYMSHLLTRTHRSGCTSSLMFSWAYGMMCQAELARWSIFDNWIRYQSQPILSGIDQQSLLVDEGEVQTNSSSNVFGVKFLRKIISYRL